MTVESATYISQLDNSYPAQSDSRTEGDDHIRLIKTTLENSFPNFENAAVTSTEAELNYVNVATLGTVEASKAVTADSSGNINFNNGDMTNVDINSGAIDGTTIGAASAAAGTFTTMTATTGTFTTMNATTVASTTLADGTVATTQSSGTNDTKVATTAFAYGTLDVSTPTNASTTLPNGLIIKWGIVADTGNPSVTFTNAFPNNCWMVQLTDHNASDTGGVNNGVALASFSTSGFTASTNNFDNTHWLAIGN